MSIQAGNNDIVNNEPLLLQYLNQSTFPIDTSAQAVVLHEKGSSVMSEGKLSFQVEQTIKILSMDAADFEQYQQLYRIINAEKDNLSIVLLNKTS